jgi:hypothetical protein
MSHTKQLTSTIIDDNGEHVEVIYIATKDHETNIYIHPDDIDTIPEVVYSIGKIIRTTETETDDILMEKILLDYLYNNPNAFETD